ncbi:hypothetical protein, partial [Actinomadura rubrisoli]|uniref:hypothetical protein n=1 Tax=Actinomadura rubrisoli TaxID=2530368 RepID=UPI001A9D0CBD
AGTGGVLAAVGTKTAVAIAGTAIVGTTAGGVGVYQASRPERPHAAAVKSAPAPPGVPLTIGRITIKAPPFWKSYTTPRRSFTGRARPDDDSYYVRTWRTCDKQRPIDASVGASSTWCPGLHVLGPTFLDDSGSYVANPYDPSDTYASRFSQDEGMSCPGHDDLRAVGVRHGAVRLANRLAPIGPRRARYREWRVPCYTREDRDGYGPTRKTRFSYVERLWYLPESKILIVDIWNTPDLERILRSAVWS